MTLTNPSGRKKIIKTNKTLSELLSKLTPSQRADLRHKIKMLEVEAELAKRKSYISKPLVKGGGVKLYKYPQQEVTKCAKCGSLTKHYFDCKIIRNERIRKINSWENPWDWSWDKISSKLEEEIL